MGFQSISADELSKLDKLSKEFKNSGNNKDTLSSEDWEFVLDIGNRLIAESKSAQPSEGLPDTYAEIDYGDRMDSDPEAINGARFDDMNYLHYTER